ncbi:hypothetical protein M5K25_025192 [Dendrobium thyrsiflorum]|uniref:Uncharacterized protein n=1 Tax=Dendrobium thyrsiflorum TaxID=117978 RepID=A0ABD0U3J9_DENTH
MTAPLDLLTFGRYNLAAKEKNFIEKNILEELGCRARNPLEPRDSSIAAWPYAMPQLTSKRPQAAAEQQPENRERGTGPAGRGRTEESRKQAPKRQHNTQNRQPQNSANQEIKRGSPKGTRTTNRAATQETTRGKTSDPSQKVPLKCLKSRSPLPVARPGSAQDFHTRAELDSSFQPMSSLPLTIDLRTCALLHVDASLNHEQRSRRYSDLHELLFNPLAPKPYPDSDLFINMLAISDEQHAMNTEISLRSMLTVVSSRQWPLTLEYGALVKMQSSNVQMIDHLFKPTTENDNDGIINKLLTSSGRRKPDQIITFKNEPQFNQIIDKKDTGGVILAERRKRLEAETKEEKLARFPREEEEVEQARKLFQEEETHSPNNLYKIIKKKDTSGVILAERRKRLEAETKEEKLASFPEKKKKWNKLASFSKKRKPAESQQSPHKKHSQPGQEKTTGRPPGIRSTGAGNNHGKANRQQDNRHKQPREDKQQQPNGHQEKQPREDQQQQPKEKQPREDQQAAPNGRQTATHSHGKQPRRATAREQKPSSHHMERRDKALIHIWKIGQQHGENSQYRKRQQHGKQDSNMEKTSNIRKGNRMENE